MRSEKERKKKGKKINSLGPFNVGWFQTSSRDPKLVTDWVKFTSRFGDCFNESKSLGHKSQGNTQSRTGRRRQTSTTTSPTKRAQNKSARREREGKTRWKRPPPRHFHSSRLAHCADQAHTQAPKQNLFSLFFFLFNLFFLSFLPFSHDSKWGNALEGRRNSTGSYLSLSLLFRINIRKGERESDGRGNRKKSTAPRTPHETPVGAPTEI